MRADHKPSLVLAVAFFLLAAALGAWSLFGEVRACAPNLCNGSARISELQPPGKSVLAWKVQGDRVLYVSNASCRRELYSVAVTGGPVVQVSSMTTDTSDPCFRNVTDEFSFSPDGAFAVYEADGDKNQHPAQGDQDYQIYSVPILGGAVVRLNPALPFDYDVERHKTGCDSQRVVFRRGKDATNKWELWSAPIRVPNGGQRISQPEEFGKDIGKFDVYCDGTVVYERDATASGVYVRYRTTVQPGGRIWTEIMSDGFESGGVTKWN